MHRSMVQKMITLGQEFGVRVIAEGIETELMAESCSELGVDLMQGYYFARPAATMATTANSLVSLSRFVKPIASEVQQSIHLTPLVDAN